MPQPEWEDLERRVARIERALNLSAEVPERASAVPAAGPPPVLSGTTLLPILGRALLGLAGAYLLRALTESDTLPSAWGVGAGILYAALWLVWAARTPSDDRLQTAMHSLTSVLVLCPLVWEATVRLHALSPWAAGILLIVFTLFGLALSWRRNLPVVATIVTLAGLLTSAGLLIATHDVVPFATVLLAIALAVEISSCLEHCLSERWVAAIMADLAVLLATWLVTGEHGLPEIYAPISFAWLLGAQVGLLSIYLASTIVRTLLRGLVITAFEIAQCAAAFLIAIGGGLRLSSEVHAIGIFSLICASACYIVSFAVLERTGRHARNFFAYSTWAILLAMAGCRILLGGNAPTVWWLLALACTWAGGHYGRLTLQVHGGVYLLLAFAAGGAFQNAAAMMLGSAHWPDGSSAALFAALAVTSLCYALAVPGREVSQSAMAQVLRMALAGSCAWILAGVLAGSVTGAYHAAFGPLAPHPYCASLRTGVLAGSALLLAWTGKRWGFVELSRLMYPAMLLGAYRLAAVDLGQQHKPALFLSLLVYGTALISLPRLAGSRGTIPQSKT